MSDSRALPAETKRSRISLHTLICSNRSFNQKGSPVLADVVTILTEAAESEVLYPNYHGCKMLKTICGYVETIQNQEFERLSHRRPEHKARSNVWRCCRLLVIVCLCAFCSHRWTESSALPDIAADLQSIQSALGIAADQRIDFVLIRDDMVARQVTTCVT